MKVSELLDEKIMKLNLEATTKNEVIDELIDELLKADVISDREDFKKDILARESLSTTGIGLGIAIPHAKSKAVRYPRVAFGVSKSGIDFKSIDGSNAKLFFMIAVNEGENDLHLKALANLSRLLMSQEFRDKLMNTEVAADILKIVKENEPQE
ncbi:MAG TPA: PTS fructose transporter subunit IIA [Eubacteriaceae bacterium]|jgi:fructose-specific phosphotransferase system IIA component|nr:PTS fructose transporter subunit IIA [Eubacteriaceae bacterium]